MIDNKIYLKSKDVKIEMGVQTINGKRPDEKGNIEITFGDKTPTAENALELLAERDIVQPLADNNNVLFTDNSGKIFIL